MNRIYILHHPNGFQTDMEPSRFPQVANNLQAEPRLLIVSLSQTRSFCIRVTGSCGVDALNITVMVYLPPYYIVAVPNLPILQNGDVSNIFDRSSK